jgi:hypothetical protein
MDLLSSDFKKSSLEFLESRIVTLNVVMNQSKNKNKRVEICLFCSNTFLMVYEKLRIKNHINSVIKQRKWDSNPQRQF